MKVGLGTYPFHFIRKGDKHLYQMGSNIYEWRDRCKRDFYQIGALIKGAGFDCIEMTSLADKIIQSSGYTGDDLNSELKRVAEYYEKIGLEIEKVHAWFQVGERKNFDWKELRKTNLIEVEKTAALGVKRLVVHGDAYTCNYGEYDGREAFKVAYEYLSPIVEKANKLGIEIAIENLFEEGQAGGDRLRYTSTTEELIELIDCFKGAEVSCCWDFGHAAAAFGDCMIAQMEEVGKRITCTHIHDNYSIGNASIHSHNGMKDLHLPVFMGKINWEDNIAALKRLGYTGVYTLEIGGVRIPSFPDALLSDNLKIMCKNLRYMVENY